MALRDEIVIELYENQRWYPVTGWRGGLLPTDRPHYSSRDGKEERRKEQCKLPPRYEWANDWSVYVNCSSGQLESDQQCDGDPSESSTPTSSCASPATSEQGSPGPTKPMFTDKDGWEYAVDFPARFSKKTKTSCVRRRKWVRTMRRNPQLGALVSTPNTGKGEADYWVANYDGSSYTPKETSAAATPNNASCTSTTARAPPSSSPSSANTATAGERQQHPPQEKAPPVRSGFLAEGEYRFQEAPVPKQHTSAFDSGSVGGETRYVFGRNNDPNYVPGSSHVGTAGTGTGGGGRGVERSNTESFNALLTTFMNQPSDQFSPPKDS